MPVTKKWRLGKGLTAITITGITVGNDGTITESLDVVTGTGTINNVSNSKEIQSEEINAVNTDQLHEVPLAKGRSVVVGLIETDTGTSPTPLDDLVEEYSYFKVVYSIGTVTNGKRTKTIYGSIGGYAEGTDGRGKQVHTLTLRPIDVNNAGGNYTLVDPDA